MSSTKFFLRHHPGDEILGPYTISELTSLAENKQLTPESELLPEEDSSEPNPEWKEIAAISEIQATLFPQKRKLSVRKRPEKTPLVPVAANGTAAEEPRKQPDSAPAEYEDREGTDVREMLAAAQGKTADTRQVKRKQRFRDLSAGLIIPGLLAMLVLSTCTFAFPHYEWIVEQFLLGEYFQILSRPAALAAIVDFVMLLLLALAATSIFPFLRFRMMAGLGFFGFFAYSFDDWTALGVLAAASIGVFGITATLNLKAVLLFLILGIGGWGFLAWQSWQGNLVF